MICPLCKVRMKPGEWADICPACNLIYAYQHEKQTRSPRRTKQMANNPVIINIIKDHIKSCEWALERGQSIKDQDTPPICQIFRQPACRLRGEACPLLDMDTGLCERHFNETTKWWMRTKKAKTASEQITCNRRRIKWEQRHVEYAKSLLPADNPTQAKRRRTK